MSKRAKVVALIAALILAPHRFEAQSVLDQVGGIIADPLKIRAGSENALEAAKLLSASLDNSFLAAGVLLEKADDKGKWYISEAKNIVAETNRLIADRAADLEVKLYKLLEKAKKLEEQVFADAKEVIRRAQCAAIEVKREVANEFRSTIEAFRKTNPGLEVLGYKEVNFSLGEIEITNPTQAYYLIKREYLHSIRDQESRTREAIFGRPKVEILGGITGDSDPVLLVNVYAEISRHARLTSCSYIESNQFDLYLKEIAEYERKQAAWHKINDIRLGDRK